MASTAGQIIGAALEMLGVYAPGDTVSAADSTRALDQLNKMLDSWSNESLVCYAITEQSLLLIPGKTSYTIGTSGTPDVNLTRPIRLIEGQGAAYVTDSNGNNYDVDVIPRDQWNQISNRTSTTQSNIPLNIFYDPQYPLGVINVYPSPTIGYRLYFDSYLQLGNLSGLTTALSFPPGYELAIQTNLAVLLGPFFKSALVSEDVKAQARESKKQIKRSNRRTNVASYDPELGQTKGFYDVYSDGFRAR